MFSCFLIAVGIFIGTTFFERNKPEKEKLLRVEWDVLAKFIGFLVVLAVLRLCVFDFAMDFFPKQFNEFLTKTQYTLMQIKFWRFGLVGWEDLFFALPIVFVRKVFKNKWVWIPYVVIMSVCFGMGHIYQSWFAGILASFYPFFISYKYGLKNGFGTVMLGHVLYDISTYFTILYSIYVI